jgi:hypothetical protein
MKILGITAFIACCLTPLSVSAAIVAGDQLVAGSLGAVKVTGPNRSSFISPGWYGGGEYFYQLTDSFALGAEASWAKPHNKRITVLGGLVGVGVDADVFTAAGLARWNFTPERSWTPYVAAGPGLHYVAQTVTVSAPSVALNDVQGTYSWRISAVAAAGVDYFCGHWLLGAQMRFETFDRNTSGLMWGGRAGYKFGK